MIVLDTNVLSEALKPAPSILVLEWLAAQESSTVFTTTITLAELRYGVELLPMGKRRTKLVAAIEEVLAEDLQGRILPFDEDAARQFGKILASRQSAGRSMSGFDGMIAAIVHCHSAILATRNVSDFADCGIRVVNPWSR